MNRNAAMLLAGLALMVCISGCRLHVDKDANGREKTVQVDTPFGGVHVNTNSLTAADLGLPVYPGAVIVKDKYNYKSADMYLSFDKWQMHLRAVAYSSSDPQDKVVAFYKKALTRYGDVLTCKDNKPVGMPTATAEGLTCADDSHPPHDNAQANAHGNANTVVMSDTLQLKAGSRRHQHMVGFESPQNGTMRYTLVSLDRNEATTDNENTSN